MRLSFLPPYSLLTSLLILSNGRNIIRDNGLQEPYKILQAELKAANIEDHIIEQQLWEIQEYNNVKCQIRPTLKKSTINCKEFSIYMYPFTGKERVRTSATFQAIRHAVTMHLASTTQDPEDACLFMPMIDTTCFCNYCTHQDMFEGFPERSDEGVLIELQSLRYWNTGKQHVIFDLSDSPCVPYDIQNAISAKAGITSFHYRPGFDVSLAHIGFVEYSKSDRIVPPSKRPYLLTFRGTRTEHHDETRKELYRIHNGKDVLMLVVCRSRFGSIYGSTVDYDSNCATDERLYESHTNKELAIGSKFALILEGFGHNSMQLVDLMSAGCIPVIVVDHLVLPFEDLLDWENFSIRVPEYKLEQVSTLLLLLLVVVVVIFAFGVGGFVFVVIL